MNIQYRKLLKVATLLATAAIIATVSAQVYSYMYIQGSGSITSGGMGWVKGTTAPAGATVEGAYVRNLNLSIPANNPRNFTDCLRLVNNDAASHAFDIEASVTSGNITKFTTFDMVIYQTDWTVISTISVKNGGSASSLSIGASETLYVRFEVDPLIGETSGDMAFTVKLTYE